MRKIVSILANTAKRSAATTLKRDANSTTCCAIFQPKAPAELKKFSKINDK